MAKMPRMTGRMSKPDVSDTKPKVSRLTPDDGSRPGIETSMPSSAAIRPLSMDPRLSDGDQHQRHADHGEDLPGTEHHRDPGERGVRRTRATQEKAPPTIDAALPRPSARPGRPAFAIGKPSMQVMIAFGSPGMRISVAVTRPPLTPPTNRAMSRMTASDALHRERERQDEHHQGAGVDPGQHADGDAEDDAAAQHDEDLTAGADKGTWRQASSEHRPHEGRRLTAAPAPGALRRPG